ncbi:MAG: sensor histidine kinase, partial [Bacillota bacterium]
KAFLANGGVVFLAFLLVTTLLWKIYFFRGSLTVAEIYQSNLYPALNLIVIVMLMHLFARMHLTMSEQSQEKKQQQQELLSAYQNLSANYEVFQALAKFQREVVAYKNQQDIYTTLLETLCRIFPFRQAMVLIPPPDFKSSSDCQFARFQLVSTYKEVSKTDNSRLITELKERWGEFTPPRARKMIIGQNRSWIALPMHGEKNSISALFVGWIRPQLNPLSFFENLSLFIRFTEQTVEWLSMFKQKERVLQHVSSIYEAVETVASHNNPHMVIELFASYARALTDCEKTIFWMENSGSGEYDNYSPIYSVKGPRESFPEQEWEHELLQAWANIREHKQAEIMDLRSASGMPAQLIGVPVKTGTHCFGMLAAIQAKDTFSNKEIIQILTILADLGAIAVERTQTEMFAEKLLVIDEQKRIANEIHDTISQNLFSIVYSIDTMSKEAGKKIEEEDRRALQDIKNLSAETARDLRALIYRLNPRQASNDTFVKEITEYLEKLARMNDISIRHEVNGDPGYLNPALCRALYRILRESTANAMRHSECSEILVNLSFSRKYSVLKISDNGKGFDTNCSLDLYSSGNRLGLVNMRELALSLRGTLDIRSKPGLGTEVTCSIPISPVSVE